MIKLNSVQWESGILTVSVVSRRRNNEKFSADVEKEELDDFEQYAEQNRTGIPGIKFIRDRDSLIFNAPSSRFMNVMSLGVAINDWATKFNSGE